MSAMHNRTRVLAAAVAAALAAGAAGVVVATQADDEPASRDTAPAGKPIHRAHLKRAVANREAFAVLNRRAGPRTRARARQVARMARRSNSIAGVLDVNAARVSRQSAAGRVVWVAPASDPARNEVGPDAVCLLVQDGEGVAATCGPAAYAQTVGLVNVTQCDGGVGREVNVLVPDGAPAPVLKRNGQALRTLPVTANTATTTDEQADAVTQANGTTLRLPPLRCSP